VIRSSFPQAPREPLPMPELEAMAKRAWIDRGVVILWPEKILDVWTRQAVINECVKLYGKSNVAK
jgi:hypothetical protein